MHSFATVFRAACYPLFVGGVHVHSRNAIDSNDFFFHFLLSFILEIHANLMQITKFVL